MPWSISNGGIFIESSLRLCVFDSAVEHFSISLRYLADEDSYSMMGTDILNEITPDRAISIHPVPLGNFSR
jgi:hypothetical protein